MMLLIGLLSTLNVATASAIDNDGVFMVKGRFVNVIPVEKQDRIDAGGNSTIGKSLTPEVALSYFLTPNVAAELSLSASKHTIKAENNSLRLENKASTWIVPPSLILQYHFTGSSFVKPYLGAGITYTMFHNDRGGQTHHKSHSTLALQAGLDIPIVKNLYASIDVKKMLPRRAGHISSDTAFAEIKMSPWIVGAGLGVSF